MWVAAMSITVLAATVGGRAMKTRRIFVSLPADDWLTKQENQAKWATVKAIENLGYTAEIFLDPRGARSLAAPQAWSAANCEDVMRRCDGCVLLGFPRWLGSPRWPIDGREAQFLLSTEYNHYEGAIAKTLGLPLLVLVQKDVLRRVVFDSNYRGFVGVIPSEPTARWLTSKQFQVPFGHWRDELQNRRDIFFGYCSSSKSTAQKIKRFLTREVGVSVLDWAVDFKPARTILDQIKEASQRCGAGVFLFTADDPLPVRKEANYAAPRDNVVFEAGYYSALKGKSRVLIVREKGAKMPADLGGDIYASLEDKNKIDPIKDTIRGFVEAL